ncbi:MAG: hypothetical protein KVP17_002301, partial [Porospora cf. gigantea B]|uniref:uncharacterized protein n=1 Tax=Porospora cf. gigantea B TaxID=2853592 RepID=UPI0035717E59
MHGGFFADGGSTKSEQVPDSPRMDTKLRTLQIVDRWVSAICADTSLPWMWDKLRRPMYQRTPEVEEISDDSAVEEVVGQPLMEATADDILPSFEVDRLYWAHRILTPDGARDSDAGCLRLNASQVKQVDPRVLVCEGPVGRWLAGRPRDLWNLVCADLWHLYCVNKFAWPKSLRVPPRPHDDNPYLCEVESTGPKRELLKRPLTPWQTTQIDQLDLRTVRNNNETLNCAEPTCSWCGGQCRPEEVCRERRCRQCLCRGHLRCDANEVKIDNEASAMIREMFLNAYGTEVLRLPLEQTQEEDEEGVVSPTAYELSVGHLSVAQRRLRGETPPDGLARDLWDRFKMSDDYPRPPTRDSYSSQRKPYHQRYNQDSRARDLMDNDFRRSFNPDRSRYARSMDRYSSRTKRAEPYRDTRADSYRGA